MSTCCNFNSCFMIHVKPVAGFVPNFAKWFARVESISIYTMFLYYV